MQKTDKKGYERPSVDVVFLSVSDCVMQAASANVIDPFEDGDVVINL